jgi:hypothetical protein
VDDLIVRIRQLAGTVGAVHIGGDSVSSMRGRGVDGRDVQHALENATVAEVRGSDVFCTGPTLDGEELTIIPRLDDLDINVSNVTT